MERIIPKGTKVRLRTTNGGDITAVLRENHYRTYDAIIEVNSGWVLIRNDRILSIEPVEGKG